jgi:thiol-disulfide isomerase/thioredoxin
LKETIPMRVPQEMRRGVFCGLLAVLTMQAAFAKAQAGVGQAGKLAEPPGLIYKEAMHPLDAVRASLGNWSASELAALSVGMRKGREACAQARPEVYEGNELCDLARLCVLGQSWTEAQKAAQQCIARGPVARRAHAYSALIMAQVRTNQLNAAQESALNLLHSVPYDAEAALVVLGLKAELDEESSPGRVLELDLAEQPAILAAIGRHATLTEANGDALMDLGALYSSAMHLAFTQHSNMDKDGAAATVASLDKALGDVRNGETAAEIERVRTRYKLLGSKLPALPLRQALQSPTAKAQIDPEYGVATILVIFPDWCTSCREMMKTLTEFARLNADTPIHAYGVVFHDDFGVPETKPAEPDWSDLAGTATFVAAPETARVLGATDYPYGVVADYEGVVRFAGSLPETAFNGNGYIEQVLTRITAQAEVERSLHRAKK